MEGFANGSLQVTSLALMFKGIVLVLASLIGLAALWMGYTLFLKGVLQTASANGEGAGVKIKLVNVGPGIFFALFGAAIVIVAIFKPLEFATTASERQLQPAQTVELPRTAKKFGPNIVRTKARNGKAKKVQQPIQKRPIIIETVERDETGDEPIPMKLTSHVPPKSDVHLNENDTPVVTETVYAVSASPAAPAP